MPRLGRLVHCGNSGRHCFRRSARDFAGIDPFNQVSGLAIPVNGKLRMSLAPGRMARRIVVLVSTGRPA